MFNYTASINCGANLQPPSSGSGNAKNFMIRKMVKGRNDDTLFSRPGYVTIGDTYQDSYKLQKYDYRVGKSVEPSGYNNWHRSTSTPGVFSRFPYLSDNGDFSQKGSKGSPIEQKSEGDDFCAGPGRSGVEKENRDQANSSNVAKKPFCATTSKSLKCFGKFDAFSSNKDPALLNRKVSSSE